MSNYGRSDYAKLSEEYNELVESLRLFLDELNDRYVLVCTMLK